MWPLISRKVSFPGRLVLSSRVVSGGASHSVADETFVVLNVLGALGRGEIDSIHVHCHGVFCDLFGSRGGRNITGSST